MSFLLPDSKLNIYSALRETLNTLKIGKNNKKNQKSQLLLEKTIF